MGNLFASFVDGREGEILGFLDRLVRMESPSQEKQCVDALMDVLAAGYRFMGFKTERLSSDRYASHLVANLSGGKGPQVLIIGHADTAFPLGTLATMPLRHEGNRLLGPGVLDPKGGLIVMFYAIQALLEFREPLKGSLRVVVNSDANPGSLTSRDHWPDLCRDVDWAFVLEPAQPDGGLVLATEPAPGIDILQKIVEEESRGLKFPVKWSHTDEASDGNSISAAGVPTVEGMGPVGGGAHTPEEYVDIPSLYQKIALLGSVLDRLVGKESVRRKTS
jgi:glutamate carboxypeptidase